MLAPGLVLACAATPPADMPETERSAWSEGIAFYAPYAKRNLLFDDDLPEIKESLRAVETNASLDGVAIERWWAGTGRH